MTTYDWLILIVELLVLAIIAYEAGKGAWHSKRNRKKRAEIYEFLGRGSSLQGNPPSIHEQTRVHEWVHQVEEWISDTRVYLGKECSPQASLVFLSDVSPSSMGIVVSYFVPQDPAALASLRHAAKPAANHEVAGMSHDR